MPVHRFSAAMFVALCMAGGVVAAPGVVGAQETYDDDPPPVTMQDLEGAVARYGAWVVTEWGLAWQPERNIVGDTFSPYGSDGVWYYTDWGWTFESDYPWGWATFHYGRWAWSANWGWVWFPDLEWGPAWVVWRSDTDYVGWAPVPPPHLQREARLRWCVIQSRHFHEHDPARYGHTDAEPPRAAPVPPAPPPRRDRDGRPATPPSWRGHPPRAVRPRHGPTDFPPTGAPLQQQPRRVIDGPRPAPPWTEEGRPRSQPLAPPPSAPGHDFTAGRVQPAPTRSPGPGAFTPADTRRAPPAWRPTAPGPSTVLPPSAAPAPTRRGPSSIAPPPVTAPPAPPAAAPSPEPSATPRPRGRSGNFIP